MAGDDWVSFQELILELKMAGICLIPRLNAVGLQALPLPSGSDIPSDLAPAGHQVHACFLRADRLGQTCGLRTGRQVAWALALLSDTTGRSL